MPSGCWRPTSWPPARPRSAGLGLAAASLACLLAVGAILWAQNPADNRDLQGLQLAWRLPLALAGSGFLYCGAWWPAGLARAVGNPVTRFLAGISYNFYIWHQYLAVKLKQWHIPPYVSELPQQTEGRLWQLRYTWIWAGLALVLAVLATELVEKPREAGCWTRPEEKAAPRQGLAGRSFGPMFSCGRIVFSARKSIISPVIMPEARGEAPAAGNLNRR